MFTKRNFCLTAVICVLSIVLLTGCNYYEVTDVSSGKVFYTTNIDHKDSAIQFEDVKTKDKITLQSYDIKQINEKEFDARVYK